MYNVGCGKQVGGLSSSLAEGDGFPRPTLATNVATLSNMPISKHQKMATNMVVQALKVLAPIKRSLTMKDKLDQVLVESWWWMAPHC
jgi:hypothetical protein